MNKFHGLPSAEKLAEYKYKSPEYFADLVKQYKVSNPEYYSEIVSHIEKGLPDKDPRPRVIFAFAVLMFIIVVAATIAFMLIG